jgi:hypothetical protein
MQATIFLMILTLSIYSGFWDRTTTREARSAYPGAAVLLGVGTSPRFKSAPHREHHGGTLPQLSTGAW